MSSRVGRRGVGTIPLVVRVYQSMRILRFTLYFLKLRAASFLGIQTTHGPLNLRWRWETWHRLRKAERKYANPGTFSHLRSDFARIWKMITS